MTMVTRIANVRGKANQSVAGARRVQLLEELFAPGWQDSRTLRTRVSSHSGGRVLRSGRRESV
jgi:hypothetical protein